MPPRRPVAQKDAASVAIHTPTVQLGLSQPIRVAIQPTLFFHSEQWITPLTKDIHLLLNAFENEWELELLAMHHHENGGPRDDQEGQGTRQPRGPFELFKGLWQDQGWNYLHLLGITDGPLRQPWGESVLRGFAQHLDPDEAPLRQIAALFAIFVFCQTQPATPVQQLLKIDIPTLDHLVSFPTRVAPALDPTSSSTLSPPPTHDVSTILARVLSRRAPLFHLVPTELYLHPKNLPTVVVRDARAEELRQRGGAAVLERDARMLLGVEEEIEWLRRGRVDELEKMRAKLDAKEVRKREREVRRQQAIEEGTTTLIEDSDGVEDDDDEEEEGGRGGSEHNNDDNGKDDEDLVKHRRRPRGEIVESWIGALKNLSGTYASVKSSGQGAIVDGSEDSARRSVLARPRSLLQLEVLNRAEEATMRKVHETGLGQTVEARVAAVKRKRARPEKGETNERLLSLVRGFDEQMGRGGAAAFGRRPSAPPKRRKRDDDAPSQSARELDAALTRLDQSSVL